MDFGLSFLTGVIVAIISSMFGYGVMTLVMSATPLAMLACGFKFDASATVIQAHVVAMFLPSFFTGHLIRRFGCSTIMLVGSVCAAACVFINISGQTSLHFWSALVLLGIAWNFLYIGGTTMLTDTYTPVEKSRVQGINDAIVFSNVTLAALSAGALHYHVGWDAVNLGVLPGIALVIASLIWLKLYDRRASTAA